MEGASERLIEGFSGYATNSEANRISSKFKGSAVI
jgi:hypothetical protein